MLNFFFNKRFARGDGAGGRKERGPDGAKMPNYAFDLFVSDANF